MAIIKKRDDVPVVKKYQDYKPYLRLDFNYNCCYCSIHENEFGGYRHYHVEHYRPKKLFPKMELMYSNLLYCCGVCNAYKLDDWPSEDPLVAGKGYLNPCDCDFDEHFVLIDTGEIKDNDSQVALYMIERLHLNRQQLVKNRKRRRLEEVQHSRMMSVYKKAIPRFAEALERDDLPDDLRDMITLALRVFQIEAEDRRTRWEARLMPFIDPEDYY